MIRGNKFFNCFHFNAVKMSHTFWSKSFRVATTSTMCSRVVYLLNFLTQFRSEKNFWSRKWSHKNQTRVFISGIQVGDWSCWCNFSVWRKIRFKSIFLGFLPKYSSIKISIKLFLLKMRLNTPKKSFHLIFYVCLLHALLIFFVLHTFGSSTGCES